MAPALFVALVAASLYGAASGCSVGTLVFEAGAAASSCQVDSDCETARSLICHADLCTVSCHDGIADGTETGVDCGGGTCPACADGQTCATETDCASGYCIGGECVSQCMDGVRDGDETDVDCGGPVCPTCAGGNTCNANSDCTSNVCLNAKCSGN